MTSRRPYLDNLKVVLIAGVIAFHGAASYVDGDWWPYANVQETHLSDPAVLVLFGVMGPFGLFMMAELFLVAGLLTPPSLEAGGRRRFVRGRLLRLGVPFLVFTQVLWPVTVYALYRRYGHVDGSFPEELARNYPDNGPLWFVGVLLLVSLAYAAWWDPHPGHHGEPRVRLLTRRRLAALVVAVALPSFAIRLAWPYGSQTPLDLGEWQWPECVVLFLLGTVASRQGWLTAVPERLSRQAGAATLLGALGVLLLGVSVALLGGEPEDLLGGPRWAALGLAALEGVLTVFGSVWLLSVAQRRFNHAYRHTPALGRASYAAFLLGALVVIALAVAARPLSVAAEVKAGGVAVVGVLVSFALALLVTRLAARRGPRG